MYFTTVVFDKYYMHFANENQPVFFHKITAQLLIFLRLFDGMVHPAGSRKEKCREKAGFLIGNPADSRHYHHVFTALSQHCHGVFIFCFILSLMTFSQLIPSFS